MNLVSLDTPPLSNGGLQNISLVKNQQMGAIHVCLSCLNKLQRNMGLRASPLLGDGSSFFSLFMWHPSFEPVDHYCYLADVRPFSVRIPMQAFVFLLRAYLLT